MKVVINGDYGGFSLSEEAIDRYIELSGLTLYKHKDPKWGTNSYYTVPYEEYKKVHREDKKTGNYYASNALCWSYFDIARNDPILVQVVKLLGEKANGTYSSLKMVDIPVDVPWYIEDYDGWEHVAEKHRTWR